MPRTGLPARAPSALLVAALTGAAPLALSMPTAAAAGDSIDPLSRAAALLPELSAQHVRLHRPSEVVLEQARIELSPAGLRVRREAHGATLEILQDFTAARTWLIDRDRAIAFELALEPPVEPAPPTDPAGTDHGESPAGGGFLGTEVCGGGVARDEGRGLWRGRSVRAWSCTDARGRVTAIELVDERHRIVILRRTLDGVVDELRDIRPMRFARDHFLPPSRLRAVGAEELLHGAPALARFREHDNGER